MGQLEGKVAIITGAAQGMGEKHAIRFVEEGAKVILTDIQDEMGQALADRLYAFRCHQRRTVGRCCQQNR